MSALWAIGLMSGTSMDGIDAALIRSDGERMVTAGKTLTSPYDEAFRVRLRMAMGERGPLEELERDLTLRHASAVKDLLRVADLDPGEVAFIGFHGQTIAHAPSEGYTRQIGDGAYLAHETGIAVVSDFRSRDVSEGGEGAPLAPLYHVALAGELERPMAVLNIGGVSNVTWIGHEEDQLLAFDCGPGNALLDDWVLQKAGKPYDHDGELAASGTINAKLLDQLLENLYFALPAPKSLDRYHFDPTPIAHLNAADGAATLAAFTVGAVAKGCALMPEAPRRWLVTGGGRYNKAIMAGLAQALAVPVDPVESVGWDGDQLEAQAFAYLALRVVAGVPTSLPSTTGVPRPTCGGRIDYP